jgi:heme A synthase
MSLVFLGSHLLKSYGSAFFRPLLHLVSIVVVQVVIGISLLLFRVPISLAVFHQFFAILVVLGYFNIVFRSFNVYLERNRVSQ